MKAREKIPSLPPENGAKLGHRRNLTAVTAVHCSVHPIRLTSQVGMNAKHLERSSKSHHPDRTATATVSRNPISKRRSVRMALNAPVGLSGEDRQKCPFTMPARATNLNRHGAAVQLNRELLVGSTVVVRNQRGTQLSARIVAQLAALRGVPTYAIEFVEQDDKAKNFWGITFPSNT
jgi:hypothetical protein